MEGRNGDRYRNVFRCGPWYQDAWEKNEKKKRERKYIQILLSLCPPPRARVTSRIVRERSLLPGPCRDRPRVMSEPEEKKKI